MRHQHRANLSVCAVVALLAAGCVRRAPVATAERPAVTRPDRTIHFPPVIITATPAGVALSQLNDAELFATGQAATEAGDNARAVQCYERIADFFPSSKYRPRSLFQAGVLLERMHDYAGALSRFLEASRASANTADGAEARFKAADEYYFLGDYESAITMLQTLVNDPFIPGIRHVEADTKRAVCLYTQGRLDEAEKLLRTVLKQIQDDYRDDTRDGYLPSQAQFYLAEVFRQHFLDVRLDPVNRTKPQLMDDLEYKAQMLLSAQGHYLRCIRFGHPEWATASGYRIGELYQDLYEHLVGAPPPPDLDQEQIEMYRQELRNRVRVLVNKAIDAYEQTLATAERVGATNPFVQETRLQLDRMKGLLLQDATTATGASPPPATTGKPPGQS